MSSDAGHQNHRVAEEAPDVLELVLLNVKEILSYSVGFALEIFKKTMRILRQPIALGIVGYLTVVIFSYAARYVATAVSQTLQPLCSIPLVSVTPVCKAIILHAEPKYPELIDLQTRFEDVMETTAISTNLALDMKNSEIAIRDLSALVKVSTLPSKVALSTSLDKYVSTAKDAIKHLSKLGAGVGGTVDSILAMDEYALKTLEDLEAKKAEWSIVSTVFFPFSTTASSRKQLMDTFDQAASVMEMNLRRLINLAVVTTDVLNQLDEQLNVLHEILSREHTTTKQQAHAIFADLWTILGGNRDQVTNFKSHLSLLSQLARYRAQASVQVGMTLVQLEQLASDLDDLRDRVAQPVLVGEIVPFEVHIATIRKGVERLVEGRGKAKIQQQEIHRRALEGPRYAELDG